jgi:hypothetical protein
MDRTEIVSTNEDVINKSRKVLEMMKSDGWKIREEIVAKRKQKMIDNMFKAEINVKKHEYNRGAVNFEDEINEELQGIVDDAQTAIANIDAMS